MDVSSEVITAVADALGRESGRGPGTPRVSVAFSAGMDSTVLLEAVCRVAPGLGLGAPRALYVDHGVEPEARAWREHAVRWCGARQVELETLPVSIPPRAASGPEAAAREARYAALAGSLDPGELLCVAHHADDQAETVLLNLLRGSGTNGLGAMRARRRLGPGTLLRPLLGVARGTLAECARHWALVWVSDPANDRPRHPRNRVRHEVLPLLQSLNPAAVPALVRSATLSRESAELAQALTAQDLAACSDPQDDALARNLLIRLPGSRRRAVLRLWCQQRGVPVPGNAYLAEIERQILQGACDRLPSFAIGSARLTVHGDRLWLRVDASSSGPQARRYRWTPGSRVRIAHGVLWAERGDGEGLRHEGTLDVRFRQGGERCRPTGRRHSQTLKRLFQEYRMPPWLRHRVPLLYRQDELVGVAGLFVCHGHEAAPGEPGWRVRWQPDGE